MKLLPSMAFLALAAAAGAASAVPTFTSGGTALAGEGLVTSVAGATTIDFNDNIIPANYSGATIFSGTTGNHAALPNDTSPYMSAGISSNQSSPVIATFTGGLSYFGFYMGSPDKYNSVQYNFSDQSSITMTGTQLAALAGNPANGDRSLGMYINAFASQGQNITSVKFISTGNAFETDNHALISAVPEPGTYAMLLVGLGLMGFMLRRKT
ncbi:Npun_F0296 family exosortase-dependent surface protein [Janthinobacterium aquaticum]|uniref:Npun_F0296 family exosortase-dependent surface protein n=1 Tax=Janthinobacterium sp. FT58W TaxID=2654254 RepID=UPI0012640E42|nr:PEP-CTERM sorting domain-containing protein [Janthinobacterium sp. FT58W]KAB8042082.1 PEP-CTERM sorting domain-containing protein [Janthinobacterium sp. FT58W]